MDESSTIEASSLEEEVAGEHVEDIHNDAGVETAPSNSKCCIRIAGSIKGKEERFLPITKRVNHKSNLPGLWTY